MDPWLAGAALVAQLASPGRLQLAAPFVLAALSKGDTFVLGAVALGSLIQPRNLVRALLPFVACALAAPFIPQLKPFFLMHIYLLGWYFAGPHEETPPTVLPQLGLAYLTVPVAALTPSWLALFCLPLLLAARARPADRSLEVEVLQHEVGLAQKGVQTARQHEQQAHQQLERKAEQLKQMEGLAQALARNPDQLQILDRVLQMARLASGCASVVMFAAPELLPVRAVSPHAQRLAGAEILRQKEPIVEQAWRSGQSVQFSGGSERLMEGERTAIAFPLEKLGVLYLGDAQRPPFTEEELKGLRLLVAQAALSLQCARYFSHLQGSVSQYEDANRNLARWSQGLSRAVEAAQALTSSLDPAQLAELLKGGALAVVGGDQVWLSQDAPWQDLAASPKPLLFEDLPGSRFARPGVLSLVVAPLGYGHGNILVGSSESRFDRLDQDLLSVLAFQAGTAFENARVHLEVVEAYKKLQDSEAQLVQSAKLAAVGQLAAGLAHELNTPLGAVVLGVDTAINQLEKRPEQARKRLELAKTSAGKARDLVAKLLYYSREGRHERLRFRLDEVAKDALQMIGQQLRLDGVEVQASLSPVPECEGSPNEVQQVLLNLLLNARDAVKGSANTLLQLRVGVEGSQVLAEVADRGPGMTEDVRARVFEPFFTTKPVGQGTGLGLAVSHEIVARHNGSLAVESVPGAGTTFFLRLPVVAS